MEFFEAATFCRLLPSYLDEESYRALQAMLASNPLIGDLIPGTGGFRKLRWADRRRRKGRRGGMRVIYYHFLSTHQIWFMTIYDKNEAQDLSQAEKNALKTAIDGELRIRQARSTARKQQSRGVR